MLTSSSLPLPRARVPPSTRPSHETATHLTKLPSARCSLFTRPIPFTFSRVSLFSRLRPACFPSRSISVFPRRPRVLAAIGHSLHIHRRISCGSDAFVRRIAFVARRLLASLADYPTVDAERNGGKTRDNDDDDDDDNDDGDDDDGDGDGDGDDDSRAMHDQPVRRRSVQFRRTFSAYDYRARSGPVR